MPAPCCLPRLVTCSTPSPRNLTKELLLDLSFFLASAVLVGGSLYGGTHHVVLSSSLAVGSGVICLIARRIIFGYMRRAKDQAHTPLIAPQAQEKTPIQPVKTVVALTKISKKENLSTPDFALHPDFDIQQTETHILFPQAQGSFLLYDFSKGTFCKLNGLSEESALIICLAANSLVVATSKGNLLSHQIENHVSWLPHRLVSKSKERISLLKVAVDQTIFYCDGAGGICGLQENAAKFAKCFSMPEIPCALETSGTLVFGLTPSCQFYFDNKGSTWEQKRICSNTDNYSKIHLNSNSTAYLYSDPKNKKIVNLGLVDLNSFEMGSTNFAITGEDYFTTSYVSESHQFFATKIGMIHFQIGRNKGEFNSNLGEIYSMEWESKNSCLYVIAEKGFCSVFFDEGDSNGKAETFSENLFPQVCPFNFDRLFDNPLSLRWLSSPVEGLFLFCREGTQAGLYKVPL